MDEFLKALGPAFAAGFAIQRFLEILSIVIDLFPSVKELKKFVLGFISLVIGFVLAGTLDISVLAPFGISVNGWVDVFVTGLVISAGTEGLNSIIKFIGYSKEDKKVAAASSKQQAKGQNGSIAAIEKVV